MVFPVLMYGCESWNVKKAERRRIDAFELWCWRRLLILSYTHGFRGGSAGEESACNVGDLGLIPGLGRYPGEGKHPLQYSWASLVAELVKNPPAMWEIWV